MKKKAPKSAIWTIYGLNRPAKPRYSGLKGVLWHVTSLYVRIRDFKQWGKCINCGKAVQSWRDLQCGHFINAARCGFALLFDLTNLNGECGGCNAYDKQKLGYERNLDARYGAGTAQGIKDRYFSSKKIGKTTKEYTKLEYDVKIRELLAGLELLGGYEP